MIDEKITRFIGSHHVLTVAAAAQDEIWCANCFYAYLPEEEGFVICSESSTRHSGLFTRNPNVAGSVFLETEEIARIQGFQFTAQAQRCAGGFHDKCRKAYLKRFPYAVLKDGEMWFLKLMSLKFTDNCLGFGKKLLWNRE